MVPTIISADKSAFLKFEIENGDSRRRKIALQDLCHLYRQGYRLNAENRNAFEKIINGTMLSAEDPKVVRWCLNSLAKIGHRDQSSKYIQAAIIQNEQSPEIVAAGIAAIAKLYNGDLTAAPIGLVVDPRISALAALQHADPKKLNIEHLKIDVGTAESELLKLALITVGLNKDTVNLFHPRHSNGTFVKELCQHNDPIVKQYSIWAIIENSKLDISDLGIDIEKIEREPVNVQAKLYQLGAERIRDKIQRHSIIHQGSFSLSKAAREGLAKGLASQYYEGLEDIIIDWVDGESDWNVKELLCEHLGRFSEDCPPYEEKALQILEADPGLKSRILLGAEGKGLYTTIRRNDSIGKTLDLFGPDHEFTKLVNDAKFINKERKQMKVLILTASPLDEKPLRLDEEARDLQEQLSLIRVPKVQVLVETKWAVRVDQVQSEILNAKPEILQFSGHGGPGEIIFENKIGESTPVEGIAIAELIEIIGTIKCVVLNACYSKDIAECCSKHTKHVIGCDGSINDDAAIAFTRAFYRALAHGENYESAFKLAKNEVRLNFSKEADKYHILP